MVDWNISAVALLTVFVSFYVISLSTYTYISSLSKVNISISEKAKLLIDANRLRRDAGQKFNTDLWLRNITLNKCCGQNQIMNYQNRCESQEYKMFNPSDIIEKLEFFVVDENLQNAYINSSRIKFKYSYYHTGFIDDAVVVNWVLNDAMVKTNYLFLQEDASLLEMDQNRTKIDKKFSTNAYCLDENNYYGSGLIAYVNPCVENLCLRKCCPKNSYYNTLQQECTPGSPNEFKPDLYFITSVSEKDIRYYLLVGMPKCSLRDSMIKINTRTQDDPVYVQEDAYLLVVDRVKGHYYYYDNKSYCVDVFSNGVEETYMSGFYCQKEANFMRPADFEVGKFAGELLKQTTSSEGPFIFRDKIGKSELRKFNKRLRGRKLPRPKALYPQPPVNPPKEHNLPKNGADFRAMSVFVFCLNAILLF